MSGNSKAVPFHGILAMGNTKDEAVNRYRLLALGKGVSAMKDGGGNFAFVTHASNKIAEMFNPQTGELDLAKDESILNSLEFEAQAGEVEANHYVCESGCGLHLVYDSDSLVKHCPSCTTAIASDDDEEESEEDESEEEETDEDLEDEDSEDEEEDEDFESESGDDEDEEDGEEDDIDAEEDDAEDEDEEDDDESDEEDDEESDEDEEDDESDDEEEEDDSNEPLVIAADSKEAAIEIYRQNRQGIATANTTVEVEYVLCSSEECNAHILSEDPALAACPACQSDVKQPEQAAQAGDEDDDESEDEDSDLEVIPEDEEEEDEEETSESNSQPQTETNMNVENVTVDMLAQLNDTAEDAYKALDVSFSGNIAGSPIWTAFYNGTPVAIATAANAGKNADIFDDVAFGNAVIAGARHVGVKATLAEMGFKAIAHEIEINSVVTDRVNAQVAEAKAGLEQDRAEHAERLMAALATAAIGINRGFFQETANPVKAALWNALSSAGVKNAEVLIDNAFRTSNDDYHRTLFAKASDIIGQPLEVQESLSKAVLGTNYMNAATASAGNSGTAFEDRLELGRSTTATASDKEEEAKPNQESLSGNDGQRISRAIAGLGRRRS